MSLIPVARLFHVSDLHFAPDHDSAALRARISTELEQRLTRWGVAILDRTRVIDWMVKRLSGHDPRARRFLLSSIRREASRDTRWNGRTWLTATGDLSTWGDWDSVQDALGFLSSAASAAGIADHAAIYGNHDVWIGQPGSVHGHPFCCSARCAELDAHRTTLRSRFFPDTWPLGPIFQAPIGTTGRHLATYALNTVLHDWWKNTWALGEVTQDRYWEHVATQDQLDALRNTANPNDVNLVLTHHPVHDPVRWPIGRGGSRLAQYLPSLLKTLANARDVANAVFSTGTPIAQVIISGHTHTLFPDPGSLPAVALCQAAGGWGHPSAASWGQGAG